MTIAPNVFFWNPYYKNTDANQEAGLVAGMKAGNVGILNEMSVDAFYTNAKVFVEAQGWQISSRNMAVAIIWDATEYTLLEEIYDLTNPGGQLWEDGTGGPDSIRKFLLTVHLRDKKSGEDCYISTAHLVPAIEKDGKVRLGTVRLAEAEKQLAAARTRLEPLIKTGQPVVFAGDWNLDWTDPDVRAWLKARLPEGMRIIWDDTDPFPTHKKRTIDYGGYANCWVKTVRDMGKFGSDHSQIFYNLDPYLPTYIVDPAKVDTKLSGVRHSDGEVVKLRDPGYPITTGVQILTIDGYKWLLTQAGIRYRADFLKMADVQVSPPGAGEKPVEPTKPVVPGLPDIDWQKAVPAYSPKAMLRMYDQVDIHLPSMERSGIYANKPGFHNSRRQLIAQGRRGDYSIQAPADKDGDDDAACGWDAKFNLADMRRVSERLMRASEAHDPRLEDKIYEWYGTLNGTRVTGYNEFRERLASSDASHLWHIHVSIHRAYSNDLRVCMGVVEVICGLKPGTLTNTIKPKYLPPYIVDPAKVSTSLYGVRISDGANIKQRPPGYVINTGIRIDIIGGVKWLVTESGYRYHMSYLKLQELP
jgi:hypothetical protein